MSIRIYVEGGGDGRNRGGKSLDIDCRRAFTRFFQRAGLGGRLPAVVACGPRRRAYDSFLTALKTCGAGRDQRPLLLVDSEGEVSTQDPWEHSRTRAGDEWRRPDSARADDAHLMVQQMESWFLADRAALTEYFGPGFVAKHLPGLPGDVESVPRARVVEGLENASRPSAKGKYTKGRDSFEILSRLDPSLVESGSTWARRLLEHLRHDQG